LHQQADHRHAGSEERRQNVGDIQHTGGKFTSNGVQVDNHNHGGVERGGSWTEGTK
jgi:phage baseplate assembly protein gpV